MRARGLFALAALFGATAAQATVADPPFIALRPIEAKLVYAETGTLSDNMLVNGVFDSWNLIIGEGAGGGRAEDILILAPVATEGAQFNEFAIPIVVEARSEDGKVIATRSFSAVLTSEEGMAYLPLWLPDVGCAGTVTVKATMGIASSTATLNLMCGE